MSYDMYRDDVEELRAIARTLYKALIRIPCNCVRTCSCGWDAACCQYEQSQLAAKGANWHDLDASEVTDSQQWWSASW
jgi:hypothetical protein